jgi:hypothetical protein
VAPANEDVENRADVDSDALCTLCCTIAQEDGWLFEATRALLEQLGTHGAEAQVEALLAERQGTLLAALPTGELGASARRARRVSPASSGASALCLPLCQRGVPR